MTDTIPRHELDSLERRVDRLERDKLEDERTATALRRLDSHTKLARSDARFPWQMAVIVLVFAIALLVTALVEALNKAA